MKRIWLLAALLFLASSAYADTIPGQRAHQGAQMLTAAHVLVGPNAITPITLKQKFGNLVDVTAYGAIGDNATNNCNAVQNAMNSNQNGVIYFPKENAQGKYKMPCALLGTDTNGHNFQGSIVSDGATVDFTGAGGASGDTDANMKNGFQFYPTVNTTGGDTTGWNQSTANGAEMYGLVMLCPLHGACVRTGNSIDVLIHHNTFSGGRYGIAAETTIGLTVDKNVFTNHINAGVALLESGNTNIWYGATPASTYWDDSINIINNSFVGVTTGGLAFILDAGSQSERVRNIQGNHFFSGTNAEIQYGYVSRNAQPTVISNWFENINYPVRMIASNANEGGGSTTLPGVTAAEPSGTFPINTLPDGFAYGAVYEGNYFQAGKVDLDVSGVTDGSVLIGHNITNGCSGGYHIQSTQGGKTIIDQGDAVSSGSCTYLNNSFGGYLNVIGMTGDTSGNYTFNGGLTLGGAFAVPAARTGTFTCTAAGTITITNANVLTASDVWITLQTVGGTISTAPVMKTKTNATGFTVLCGAADTSVYRYTVPN